METKKEKKEPVVNENGKHQLLLRLSNGLWEDLQQWAQDDFRSINGQIEYLLAQAVAKRKKNK